MTTANLKEGSKVIVNMSNKRFIGEIIKKTPTGFVDVKYSNDFRRFRPDGVEKGDGEWCRTYLSEYTEEVEKEIKKIYIS